jgi:hypothetical protein
MNAATKRPFEAQESLRSVQVAPANANLFADE